MVRVELVLNRKGDARSEPAIGLVEPHDQHRHPGQIVQCPDGMVEKPVVEGELRELLGDIDGEIRVVVAREPLETPADAPIAELVSRHAGGPDVVGVPFWADSALLSAAGIPTVVFGPAGEGAHAVQEWVDLASVERCRDLYVAVAAEFCG